MDIVEQLMETIYKVYNPQEESKETARTYDSENLRNMFIGTIFGGEHQDTINNLRDCIDKIKTMKKNSEITEDDQKYAEEKIQKITDEFIKKAEEVADAKTKEIMEI